MLGRFKSAANAFYSAINLDGTAEGSRDLTQWITCSALFSLEKWFEFS